MKTVEIRKKLIAEINLSNNKKLLEELYLFLNEENETEEIYRLSAAQKAAIEEAREQVKKGDYHNDKEANQEIEQWLNK